MERSPLSGKGIQRSKSYVLWMLAVLKYQNATNITRHKTGLIIDNIGSKSYVLLIFVDIYINHHPCTFGYRQRLMCCWYIENKHERRF